MSRAATQPGRAPPPRLERKAARERTRTGCRVALRPIVFVARPMTDVVRPITDVVRRPITDVAVGVVFDATGRVLVGQRVAGKPYGGWWEFPGGKFEPGENAHAALVRELDEELGISVERSDPWLVREHVYEHAHVRTALPPRRQLAGAGSRSRGPGAGLARPGCDRRRAAAAGGDRRSPLARPPAPLLDHRRRRPRHRRFLEALDARLEVLARHWSDPHERAMLLLREPALDRGQVAALHAGMRIRIARAGLADRLPLLVSSRHAVDDPRKGSRTRDGLHLTGRDLGRHACAATAPDRARARRPHLPGRLVSRAWRPAAGRPRGRGPGRVRTRPADGQPSIGPGARLDCPGAGDRNDAGTRFALGGVGAGDLDRARRSGAHGIAMQRAAWR